MGRVLAVRKLVLIRKWRRVCEIESMKSLSGSLRATIDQLLEGVESNISFHL